MKSLLGLYFSASLFFFSFPHFLHKSSIAQGSAFGKVLFDSKILNICHRGNPRRVAENTLQSFESCEAIGDMLEMDVCSTRDNVLVVHHDKDLLRTCGIASQISQVNYKELPSLQKDILIHFDTPGKKIQTNGQKIPTLQQIFQRFPKMPMNIELKTPSVSSTDQLLQMIKNYKREQITIIGIRNAQSSYLSKKAQNSKDILQFMSDGQVAKLLLFYFSGLLPFVSIPQKILQIPLYTINFHKWKQEQWKNQLRTFTFFTGLKLLNYLMIPLVWHLKKRGIMTFYWVCNTQQQFQRALFCGASGIITDEPQLLSSFLTQHAKK